MKLVKYRIRIAFCRGRVGEEETALGLAVVAPALPRRGEVAKAVTSHPIVGKSFTELIDHDEQDAQRVTEATLAERNTAQD